MIGSVSEFQQQLAAQKCREPLTPAHAADEAALEAQCGPDGRCDSKPVTGEAARKAIAGLEAEPGPGTFPKPRTIRPEDFRRGYLEAGHAARSPMAAPPNTAPLPPAPRGVLTPVQLPGTPAVTGSAGPAMQGIAAHQARAVTSRPPARGQ